VRPATRIGVVLGSRPEAIKLAPVIQAIRARSNLEAVVISTGQNGQMLTPALDAFGLRPDHALQSLVPGQTLHDTASRTLLGLRELFREQPRPFDWVVVQGDTTTAFAAALAAFYAQIPVAHVEAGLRSGRRYAPFPEEINRRLVDQLSERLFAPTQAARDQLLAEGFRPTQVHVTGNTVVDALQAARKLVRGRRISLPGVADAALAGRRMLLVTAHRQESFGPGLLSIFRALRRLVEDLPDVCVVYPPHLDPSVDGPAHEQLGGRDRIHLVPPLSYLEFVAAMERAHLVLTDSGSVQEEAPSLGKPLVVLRDVTERPEGIAAGVARLAGTSERRIYDETRRLLEDDAAYRRMATGINPYGDGRASERIVDLLQGNDAAATNTLATRALAS
jgi:UDP-N-acetylglucosamine 2-epimerase (non-hydrolysing)